MIPLIGQNMGLHRRSVTLNTNLECKLMHLNNHYTVATSLVIKNTIIVKFHI